MIIELNKIDLLQNTSATDEFFECAISAGKKDPNLESEMLLEIEQKINEVLASLSFCELRDLYWEYTKMVMDFTGQTPDEDNRADALTATINKHMPCTIFLRILKNYLAKLTEISVHIKQSSTMLYNMPASPVDDSVEHILGRQDTPLTGFAQALDIIALETTPDSSATIVNSMDYNNEQ